MSTTPTEPFRAVFRCSDGCDFRAELIEVVYRCPRCQGLLEVVNPSVPVEATLGAVRDAVAKRFGSRG